MSVVPNHALVSDQTLCCLLLYSMRYAMGRMSAATSDVADWVLTYAGHLDTRQIEQMAEEIEFELRLRENRGEYLGSAFDHQTWVLLAWDLRDILRNK